MHHFRGKLLDGNRVHLSPANAYVHFNEHATSGPVRHWNGYVLVDSETALDPGGLDSRGLDSRRLDPGGLHSPRLHPGGLDPGRLARLRLAWRVQSLAAKNAGLHSARGAASGCDRAGGAQSAR